MTAKLLLNNDSARHGASLVALAFAALPLLVACGGGGGGAGDPTPTAMVSTATAGVARYGQLVLLTLTGSNLDQSLTVTSAGCTGVARSTTAPTISTATTAYFTCRVSALGAQQFTVVRASDNINLGSAAYTVAVPQVTMTVGNGAAVSGTFVITLTPVQAPITVNNFLDYVNAGYYAGTVFHRVIAGFAAQGGGFNTGVTVANLATTQLKPPPTGKVAIELEDNTGLLNTALTLAMARTGAPNSATSQFFVNLGDNPNLNRRGDADALRGYAVFGQVSSGASVITAISGAPCTVYSADGSCLPIPNLVITSATQTQ